jgi:hypothetical protein
MREIGLSSSDAINISRFDALLLCLRRYPTAPAGREIEREIDGFEMGSWYTPWRLDVCMA